MRAGRSAARKPATLCTSSVVAAAPFGFAPKIQLAMTREVASAKSAVSGRRSFAEC